MWDGHYPSGEAITMINIIISLDHYMELVLHNRLYPYAIITKGDDIWNAIHQIPASDRLSYVVENEEYTIGFNGQPMSLANVVNGYRLWHRKDWELCDNHRQEAVQRIDKAQADYKASRAAMLEAVKESMLSKGITPLVWGMLAPTLSDTQIKDMFSTIKTTR